MQIFIFISNLIAYILIGLFVAKLVLSSYKSTKKKQRKSIYLKSIFISFFVGFFAYACNGIDTISAMLSNILLSFMFTFLLIAPLKKLKKTLSKGKLYRLWKKRIKKYRNELKTINSFNLIARIKFNK